MAPGMAKFFLVIKRLRKPWIGSDQSNEVVTYRFACDADNGSLGMRSEE